MKNRQSQWLVLCVAAALLTLHDSACLATTPFGDTWIIKRDGVWACPHFYTCDLIVSNEQQRVRFEVPLKRLFPGADYAAHVNRTTGGPLWGLASLPFIVQLGGEDYFYMRCWTGKQLLLALDTAELALPDRFASQLAEEERKQVLATLTNGISNLRSGDGLWGEGLNGAMLIAAFQGLSEAKPLLETIEALAGHYGPFSFIPEHSYGAGLGERSFETFFVAEHRRFAQMALRRLGFTPKGYPAIIFGKSNKDVVFPPEVRAAGVSQLRLGQTSREVHQLMGPPDYLETAVAENANVAPANQYREWVDAWRYDFAREADFSVLVIWNDQGRVERVEKVTPGLWRGDALFTSKAEKPIFTADGSVNGIRLYSDEFTGKIEVLLLENAGNSTQEGASTNTAQPHR